MEIKRMVFTDANDPVDEYGRHLVFALFTIPCGQVSVNGLMPLWFKGIDGMKHEKNEASFANIGGKIYPSWLRSVGINGFMEPGSRGLEICYTFGAANQQELNGRVKALTDIIRTNAKELVRLVGGSTEIAAKAKLEDITMPEDLIITI